METHFSADGYSAPEESGFASAWNEFWDATADAVKRANAQFLGGDFNMALFVAAEELGQRGVEATFLGSYQWRKADTRGSGGSAQPPALTGQPGLEGVRYDSLGLFAIAPVTTFSRLHSVAALRGDGAVPLRAFEEGQGYKASAYIGGEASILRALGDVYGNTHGGGVPLPYINQKALCPEVWDAPGRFLGRGAHMPLLFYVGERSARSAEALAAREGRMTDRGWGPSSANRWWAMSGKDQGKGKGSAKGKGKEKGKGKDQGKGKKGP